jgi:Fe-S cluster assembly protein SufD
MNWSLPTKRDEAWRYSKLAVLEQVWPLRVDDTPPETLSLANGTQHTRVTSDGRDHIVLDIPANAQVTLVQSISGNHASYARLDIHLGSNAKLSHVIRQTAGPACVSLTEITVTAEANAAYDATVLNIGSDFGRLTFDLSMQGETSDFQLHAVQLAHASQNLEIITRTHHKIASCTSAQVIRSVASDMSTASYLGKIHVWPEAQKTDARQSAKALLLARTATANIKPELEIHADDVKCAHGATVGELDKQALFYMATRGIDPAEAKALLTEAFLLDVLDAIADDVLKAELENLIASKLRTMTGAAT